MRPDEHKKKKNATYKKKHGIVKDTSDKKDDKTKKDKSTTENKNEGQTTKQGSETKGSQSKVPSSRRQGGASHLSDAKAENNSSSVSSSDTENEDISSRKVPKTLFRRREIVSNWQKYELPPDAEEKISARGEKYEKLLSMTGEAISHFRFKDELVWDDPGDAASSNDACSEFLSVNLAELSQSLACLPVHHILGIRSNVFPEEQLSSMINMAQNTRSLCIPDIKEGNTGYRTSHPDENESSEVSTNCMLHTAPENKQNNPVSALMTPSTQRNIESTKTLLPPVASVNMKSSPADTNAGFVGQKTFKDKSGSTLKDPVGKLVLQDNDLDVLLNTDNLATEVKDDDRTSQEKTAVANLVPEAEVKSTSDQSDKTKEHSKFAAESDDLEAWLDSVLDD